MAASARPTALLPAPTVPLSQITNAVRPPLAAFSDPGMVGAADQELARALVLVERAGGQNVPRAKLAVRQLLAERDRVLREPFAM